RPGLPGRPAGPRAARDPPPHRPGDRARQARDVAGRRGRRDPAARRAPRPLLLRTSEGRRPAAVRPRRAPAAGAAQRRDRPRHVVVPLREELERTEIRVGRVTGADPATQTLMYQTPDGRADALEWDQLVVALGSISRVVPVPGLAEHGLGFKTLSEAIALRNRALLNLEIAESLEDPEARRSFLSFVFIGAGYAGVEGIAELQDYVADVIDRYPRCRIDGTRWLIADADDRIMHEISEGLADFAARELPGRGIEVRPATRLEAADADRVALSTGAVIPTRLLGWT